MPMRKFKAAYHHHVHELAVGEADAGKAGRTRAEKSKRRIERLSPNSCMHPDAARRDARDLRADPASLMSCACLREHRDSFLNGFRLQVLDSRLPIARLPEPVFSHFNVLWKSIAALDECSPEQPGC